MSHERVLNIIKQHPNGLWIREIARRAGLSPATICNYIYGYYDRKGRFIPPVLKDSVTIIKLGDGALTIIKPK
ncbi:MAG: hypothetical protein J7K68_04675 [Candidatus Diapherotrites archaeon]|nr:hypothetical protein [Candidatus Diapherotrites archaeon]